MFQGNIGGNKQVVEEISGNNAKEEKKTLVEDGCSCKLTKPQVCSSCYLKHFNEDGHRFSFKRKGDLSAQYYKRNYSQSHIPKNANEFYYDKPTINLSHHKKYEIEEVNGIMPNQRKIRNGYFEEDRFTSPYYKNNYKNPSNPCYTDLNKISSNSKNDQAKKSTDYSHQKEKVNQTKNDFIYDKNSNSKEIKFINDDLNRKIIELSKDKEYINTGIEILLNYSQELIELVNVIHKEFPGRLKNDEHFLIDTLLNNVDLIISKRIENKNKKYSEDEKKMKHIVSEHERRDSINIAIKTLGGISKNNSNKSKIMILYNTIYNMLELRLENERLKKELRELKNK